MANTPPIHYIIFVVSAASLVSLGSVKIPLPASPYAVAPGCDYSWPRDTSGGLSYSCFARREGEQAGGSPAGWLGVRATDGKQHDSGSGGLWRQPSALDPSLAHAAHRCHGCRLPRKLSLKRDTTSDSLAGLETGSECWARRVCEGVDTKA